MEEKIKSIANEIFNLVSDNNINDISLSIQDLNENENVIKLEVKYNNNFRYKIEKAINKKPAK